MSTATATATPTFDTSFLADAKTRRIIDDMLTKLAAGNFTRVYRNYVVNTVAGAVVINLHTNQLTIAYSKYRTAADTLVIAWRRGGRFVSDIGTAAERLALFDHIEYLLI